MTIDYSWAEWYVPYNFDTKLYCCSFQLFVAMSFEIVCFLKILYVNHEMVLSVCFQFKPEEITGIMNDFNEPGFLAPTGLYLGGTKYMVIQGEPGAVIRGKKVFHLFPFLDDWQIRFCSCLIFGQIFFFSFFDGGEIILLTNPDLALVTMLLSL